MTKRWMKQQGKDDEYFWGKEKERKEKERKDGAKE